MTKSNRLAAALSVATITCLSLGACAKHVEAPPMAALPPPPPTPPPPPPPSADAVLQGKLGQLGASASDAGLSVSFPTAKFKGSTVAFDDDDKARIDKISALLKDTPHLRVLIEGYAHGKGSKAHSQRESQARANAVLRDMTADGADESRLQALGKGMDVKDQGVDLVFSDAEGQFTSPANAAPGT